MGPVGSAYRATGGVTDVSIAQRIETLIDMVVVAERTAATAMKPSRASQTRGLRCGLPVTMLRPGFGASALPWASIASIVVSRSVC